MNANEKQLDVKTNSRYQVRTARSQQPAASSSQLFQILLRYRMRRVFAFPVNGQHPPAFAVVDKLKVIDASGEGHAAFFVTPLVAAPGFRHVVPSLNALVHRTFVKALLVA